MKNLAFIALSCLLISCSNNNSDTKSDEAKIEEAAPAMAYFGEPTTEDGAVSTSELMAKLDGNDSIRIKLVGTIEKVCQKKGCWMSMRVNDDQSLHVSFKDYGFFVPKDVDGKEAVIDGYAYMETMSVDDLRHYAEDEGKTPEEIEAITEPETKLSFVADGAIVKDYEITKSDESPAEETMHEH